VGIRLCRCARLTGDATIFQVLSRLTNADWQRLKRPTRSSEALGTTAWVTGSPTTAQSGFPWSPGPRLINAEQLELPNLYNTISLSLASRLLDPRAVHLYLHDCEHCAMSQRTRGTTTVTCVENRGTGLRHISRIMVSWWSNPLWLLLQSAMCKSTSSVPEKILSSLKG
jgi:hypothetical protein